MKKRLASQEPEIAAKIDAFSDFSNCLEDCAAIHIIGLLIKRHKICTARALQIATGCDGNFNKIKIKMPRRQIFKPAQSAVSVQPLDPIIIGR